MQQSRIWRVHSSTASLSGLVPLVDAPNQSLMKEQLSSLVIILTHLIIYLNISELATIKKLSFFSADEPPYIAAASEDGIWKQDLDSIVFVEQMVSYIGDVKGKNPEISYIEHNNDCKRHLR